MPPPPAPGPEGPSFQTVSLAMVVAFDAMSRVPPQATAFGLEEGKSACALPSLMPSEAPSSPAAAKTVTPSAPAAWNAASNCFIDAAVQPSSAPPQLIETTDGLRTVSCTP